MKDGTVRVLLEVIFTLSIKYSRKAWIQSVRFFLFFGSPFEFIPFHDRDHNARISFNFVNHHRFLPALLLTNSNLW